MTYEIKRYKHSYFEEIRSWWIDRDLPPPEQGMMIVDGTFVVVDENDVLQMTLTAYFTQSIMGYLEGYCARPGLEKSLRNEYGKALWDHCFQYLKSSGCDVVICYCDKEKLIKRYQELGMMKMGGNLTQMAKVFWDDELKGVS